MFVDFILNGQGSGSVGRTVADPRFDAGLYRPYKDNQGYRCVTLNTGRFARDNKTGRDVPVFEKHRIDDLAHRGIYSPVANATSMRKEDWIELDKVVVRAARQRLRAWALLR